MTIRLASFNAVDLPIQFKYKPVIPKKRQNVTHTAGAAIIQAALPDQTIWPGTVIEWSCERVCQSEFKTLFYDVYNVDAAANVDFIGYYGESYVVILSSMDVDEVVVGTFNLAGTMTVVYQNTDYNGNNNLLAALAISPSGDAGSLPLTP